MLSGTTVAGTMHISRIIPYNRPKPAYFRLALHRMLRTPIPILHNKVKCHNCRNTSNNNKIDAYGDHIIACTSKSTAHNEIRDCLATIIRTTATITHDIPSENHISLEPVGLTQTDPFKRPADILLTLSEQTKSNITKIAIDTTFIGTNTRSAAELAVSRSLMTDKVFRHHEADCRIIPATFDSFGRLGPTITDFLFGPNNAYKSFERHTNNLSPAAQQAIANTTEKHRIHSLLPRANKDWKLKHGEVTWYTPSYKAKTPSMWAKQYLSINMINAAPQQPYRIPRQMQNKRTKIIEAQHTTTTSPSYVDIPIRE